MSDSDLWPCFQKGDLYHRLHRRQYLLYPVVNRRSLQHRDPLHPLLHQTDPGPHPTSTLPHQALVCQFQLILRLLRRPLYHQPLRLLFQLLLLLTLPSLQLLLLLLLLVLLLLRQMFRQFPQGRVSNPGKDWQDSSRTFKKIRPPSKTGFWPCLRKKTLPII